MTRKILMSFLCVFCLQISAEESFDYSSREDVREYVKELSANHDYDIDELSERVKKQLTKYSSKVTDKAIKVKLNETKNLIKPLCKKASVHDNNVSNLLNYYELVNELKTIHG